MTHLTQLPLTENNLAAAMLASAIEAKRAPAIAFAKWLDNPPKKKAQIIPNNCLPPVPKPAAKVSGNQLLVLRALQTKCMTGKVVAEYLELSPNSVSDTTHTLMERHLIRVARKLKRKGPNGAGARVYAISEAGRRALEKEND